MNVIFSRKLDDKIYDNVGGELVDHLYKISIPLEEHLVDILDFTLDNTLDTNLSRGLDQTLNKPFDHERL